MKIIQEKYLIKVTQEKEGSMKNIQDTISKISQKYEKFNKF